jgi:hypothetical protein
MSKSRPPRSGFVQVRPGGDPSGVKATKRTPS